ncbi:MAG: DUF4388 domain-containing protein [bacterium]|nr:DUF4388 domain-containing protein [bacterium]
MLSEKGSLKETPAMKLLLTLFENGLTGILYVKNVDILKVLYFNKGKLIWAISNSDDDKLENILIASKLVDPDILLKVKKEAHVSDSIGKLLVEKGLITLEELIESSKSQLKRIIYSILKWTHGGFQFVKDTPPERLLSLDLSISDFIVNYILEEVELSEIWKHIGSLQVEFIKNPDDEKVSCYKLSEKQKDLLNSFTGENKLETILSRYTGGHRESLLKIIYFFLMSELLIKKEFDLSDSSVFDDSGFDYFGADNQPRKTEAPAPLPADDTPGFPVPAKKNAEPEYSYEPSSRNPVEKWKMDRKKETVPFPEDNEADEGTSDGRKIKVFNLVLIILILVLGGIILLLLPLLLNDTPPLEQALKENKKNDIFTIEEKSPKALTDNGEVPNNPDEKDPDRKKIIPDILEGTKKPEEKKTPEVEKKKTEKKEEKTKPIPGKKAITYFLEGNMFTAGDIWKNELKKADYKYSILLEMDCLKQSVTDAYKRLKNKKSFYILNRRVKGRSCFLVMLGRFHTEKEAAKEIKDLPAYFFKQKPPAEVVDLAPYL